MLILDPTPTGVRLYGISPASNPRPGKPAAVFPVETVFASLPAGQTIFGYLLPNGADLFRQPVEQIEPPAIEKLETAASIAPDENAAAARLVEEGLERFPGGRHFILCESAFFTSLPEQARYYALPQPWRERYPRTGREGLQHAWVWKKTGTPRRLVSICLGDRPHIAAVLEGAAVESSASPNALEGLPSLTACGGIDPTIVMDLLRQGRTTEEVRSLLQKKSGFQLFADKPAPLSEVIGENEFPCQMLLQGLLKETGAALATLEGADFIILSADHPSSWQRVITELEQRLGFFNLKIRVVEAPRERVLADTLEGFIH